MNDYWYLCGDSGTIKYAGRFANFDECDEHLEVIAHAIWIFTGKPEIEERYEYI